MPRMDFYTKFLRLQKTKVLPQSVYVEMEYKYKMEDSGYPFSYGCTVQYHILKK